MQYFNSIAVRETSSQMSKYRVLSSRRNGFSKRISQSRFIVAICCAKANWKSASEWKIGRSSANSAITPWISNSAIEPVNPPRRRP